MQKPQEIAETFEIHPTKIIVRSSRSSRPALIEMDRFEELLQKAGKEFTDGRDIGGPNLPKPNVPPRSSR